VKSLRKSAAPAPATPASTAAPTPAPAPAKAKPKPKTVAAPAKVAPSAGTSASLPPGVYRDCGQCPEMVDMPSGQFNMGSTDDPSSSPVRAVSIDYSFAVARSEVTVGQWALCVEQAGCRENSRHAGIQADRPAINLSWEDATDYVAWLSEYTGRSYRMLSEAEWEFVARGGTANNYWWGSATANGLSDCRDCGGDWDKNAPKGPLGFPSNGFGIHGTSGGAQEWVMDCWSDNHENATGDGTAVVSAGCSERVLKGGSWRSKLPAITSYSRSTYEASVRYVTNGVRVALDTAELPPLVEN